MVYIKMSKIASFYIPTLSNSNRRAYHFKSCFTSLIFVKMGHEIYLCILMVYYHIILKLFNWIICPNQEYLTYTVISFSWNDIIDYICMALNAMWSEAWFFGISLLTCRLAFLKFFFSRLSFLNIIRVATEQPLHMLTLIRSTGVQNADFSQIERAPMIISGLKIW